MRDVLNKEVREACLKIAAGLDGIEKSGAPEQVQNAALEVLKAKLVESGIPVEFFASVRAYNHGQRTMGSLIKELAKHIEDTARRKISR